MKNLSDAFFNEISSSFGSYEELDSADTFHIHPELSHRRGSQQLVEAGIRTSCETNANNEEFPSLEDYNNENSDFYNEYCCQLDTNTLFNTPSTASCDFMRHILEETDKLNLEDFT